MWHVVGWGGEITVLNLSFVSPNCIGQDRLELSIPRARHARNAFESGTWRYGKSFVRLNLIPLVVPRNSVGNFCRVCGLSVSAERSKSVEELVATLCVTSLKQQQHSESVLARLLLPAPCEVSMRISSRNHF